MPPVSGELGTEPTPAGCCTGDLGVPAISTGFEAVLEVLLVVAAIGCAAGATAAAGTAATAGPLLPVAVGDCGERGGAEVLAAGTASGALAGVDSEAAFCILEDDLPKIQSWTDATCSSTDPFDRLHKGFISIAIACAIRCLLTQTAVCTPHA